MEDVKDMPSKGYVVIRCHDGVIVAKLQTFAEECDRALMYRRNGLVSFMPLQDDQIIGTPKLFTQILKRAGYRISHPSDNISS